MRRSPLDRTDDRTRAARERAMVQRIGRTPDELGRAAAGQLAEMQGGAIATWQLRALGWSESQIGWTAARDGWQSVQRGVWVMPGVPVDAITQVWVAVLALSERDGAVRAVEAFTPGSDVLTVLQAQATERVFLGGGSAAWALGVWGGPPAAPVLTVAASVGPDRDDMRIIRTSLDPGPLSTRIADLRVVGPGRMAWELAWLLRRSPQLVERLVDDLITADRLRILAIDDVLALVDEPCLWDLPMRVPARLREAAAILRPGFSHSRTEAVARQVVQEVAADLGLEVHPRPLAIRDGARIVAEADIALPALRHDVEIDGPHHLLFAQQARDRRRDGALAALAQPWTVARYEVELVDGDPAEFRRLVRADLRRRIADAA